MNIKTIAPVVIRVAAVGVVIYAAYRFFGDSAKEASVDVVTEAAVDAAATAAAEAL